MVTFITLDADEPHNVLSERVLSQSVMLKCPFAIMVSEHYRDDGTCKCDDGKHRQFMIAEWEYLPSDFANIPLRKE